MELIEKIGKNEDKDKNNLRDATLANVAKLLVTNNDNKDSDEDTEKKTTTKIVTKIQRKKQQKRLIKNKKSKSSTSI